MWSEQGCQGGRPITDMIVLCQVAAPQALALASLQLLLTTSKKKQEH